MSDYCFFYRYLCFSLLFFNMFGEAVSSFKTPYLCRIYLKWISTSVTKVNTLMNTVTNIWQQCCITRTLRAFSLESMFQPRVKRANRSSAAIMNIFSQALSLSLSLSLPLDTYRMCKCISKNEIHKLTYVTAFIFLAGWETSNSSNT